MHTLFHQYKLCLFIYLSIIFSISAPAQVGTLTPSPLELLQKVVPSEVPIRPKLSFKENLTTILAELEIYARNTSALPDSNNLVSGWTAHNDRLLIETLIGLKDQWGSEESALIQGFLTKRMKQALIERPADLWNSYFVVSKLFPENYFWLSFYESLFSQPKINWSTISNINWIVQTLLPAFLIPKSSLSTWNKDFINNCLSLVQGLWQDSLANSSQSLALFWKALELVDRLFSFTDARLQTLSVPDLNDYQKQFFDFLQTVTLDPNRPNLLASITNSSPSVQIAVESAQMNLILFGTLEHRSQLTFENKRVKAFVALHDNLVQSLFKPSAELSETTKYRLSLTVVFYLRTLIHLKTFLSNEGAVISRGQWVSNKQFQRNFEMLWQEELSRAQQEAQLVSQLTLYNLSLIDKCYREQLQTPTCQMWREAFPLHLKDSPDKNSDKNIVWELNSKIPISIPPGSVVFNAGEELHINAPEVRFHLLSRIVIPSGTIQIDSPKIVYPWIDVSGEMSKTSTDVSAFGGKKPWFKNSQICSPRDYLEGTTTIVMPRHPEGVQTGFSIKNPFPKTVLVCASDAFKANREQVADILSIVDVGAPPTLPTADLKLDGTKGGQIKFDLSMLGSNEKSQLLYPLVLAMGADGKDGMQGHSSPLCHNDQYQSFKLALSLHKDGFNKWIEYTKANSSLSLLSQDSYGDQQFGLFEINWPRTSGTNGGSASSGGQVQLLATNSTLIMKPQRWFLGAGLPGVGGKAGSCGPNEVTDGKPGLSASNGSVILNRR